MWPGRVSDPRPLALESDALPIPLRGRAHDMERKYELLTARSEGRGGMGIRTTNGKIHMTQNIYQRIEARSTHDQRVSSSNPVNAKSLAF